MKTYKRTNSLKNAVVWCYYQDNQTVKEISDRLNIPEKTLYKWILNKDLIIKTNKKLLKNYILVKYPINK